MDIHVQSLIYIVLIGIGNVKTPLPNPLVIPAKKLIHKLRGGLKNIYDRVFQYMTSKAIEGSITKTPLNKLWLN